MSASDMLILSYISSYGLPILSLLGLILILMKNFKKVKRKLFTKFLTKFEQSYGEAMKIHKEALFAPLDKLESLDWKLRNEGLIRVLEIGVRTGPHQDLNQGSEEQCPRPAACSNTLLSQETRLSMMVRSKFRALIRCIEGENLKYYPRNSRVTLVDKNVYLQSYLEANSSRISHLKVERFIVSHGDDLRGVPSNSVDVVVATLVLCSAANVGAVLREIRRVLAPGGKYYFMEHVHERSPTFLRTVQLLLSASGLWPAVFDGCHLDRDAARSIERASFKDLSYKYVSVEDSRVPLLNLMKSHLIGSATK
uniref:Methyltransferase type 11 domain-containing protein n=1 Tax=Timema genevievae TaxID=629358 RepID=A0A7R9K7F9_TIMGE|nr:unnamed protein product [Timema genevievae]